MLGYVIIGLLAVIAGEVGALVWKSVRAPSGGAPGPAAPGETESDGAEFEKRWREGIDAMMEYDPGTAGRSARGDRNERN